MKPRNSKSRSANPKARRGFTLIELLIVISIGSVVVGVCITTMHMLLRIERDQARAVRQTMVLSRIRQVFVDDVHGATRATAGNTAEGQPQLELTSPEGRRVLYVAEENSLRREAYTGAERNHQDAYHFPPGSEFRFDLEASAVEVDPPPAIIRLLIDIAATVPESTLHRQGKGQGGPSSRTIPIEGVLNHDRRFAGGEE